jgi:Cell division protein
MTDSPPPSPYNPYDPSSTPEPPTTKFSPPSQPGTPDDENQPTTKFSPPSPPGYTPPTPPTTYGQGGQPAAWPQPPQPSPYAPPTTGYGQPAPPTAGQGPATPYPTSGVPNQEAGYGVYPPQSSPPAQPYNPGVPGQPGYPPPPGVPGAVGAPGGGFPPAPPAKKKSKAVLIIVIVAVLLLCCGGVGVGGYFAFRSVKDTALGDRTVVYEVTGEGTADIMYSDANAGLPQENDVSLPWTKELTVPASVLVLSLTATRADTTGQASGEITCRIVVDGKEVIKNSASGPFAIASCVDSTFG